jgi:hypothetical protein
MRVRFAQTFAWTPLAAALSAVILGACEAEPAEPDTLV